MFFFFFILNFFSFQGMQCNGSDGSRLPGLWDNIGATPVRLPLPPPARDCPELENENNFEI